MSFTRYYGSFSTVSLMCFLWYGCGQCCSVCVCVSLCTRDYFSQRQMGKKEHAHTAKQHTVKTVVKLYFRVL